MIVESALAEEQPVGTMCTWDGPPRVAAPIGMLPFTAPSAVGRVAGVKVTGGRDVALVRFQYKNPTGGTSWSDAIEVQPGQQCRAERRE